MFGKGVFKCLAKVFSNVWQECFQTFGKSVFKCLARVFSNVWQECFQTFGNNLWNVAQNCRETPRTFLAKYTQQKPRCYLDFPQRLHHVQRVFNRCSMGVRCT